MSVSSNDPDLDATEYTGDAESAISEVTPILGHQQLRYSIIGDGDLEPEMIDDLQSKYEQYYRAQQQKLVRRRFWWFCGLGIVAIITMHLSFLPRTSLSRDFRRWYGLHLTKSDIKRNYLLLSDPHKENNGISNDDSIDTWLSNLTRICVAKNHSLASSDNPDLELYVSSTFKLLGFHPQVHAYDVPQLRLPGTLSLSLVDQNGAVVYNARLAERGFSTQAFFSFGSQGDVTAPFTYVGEGTPQCYTREVTGRIVIAKSNLSSVLSTAEKIQIAQHNGAVGFVVFSDDVVSAAVLRDSGSMIPAWENLLARPSIPAIPVSQDAIMPILDASSSEDFLLHLRADFSSGSPRKVSNIVASMKGILDDGDIIIGAGRDSLTSESVLSNHAVLFEIMKHFHQLKRLGWKPLRNIKFVSWDSTRSSMVGSQLYGDDPKMHETKRPVLCYINLDHDMVRGSNLRVESSPFFNHVLRKTAKFIPFPDKEDTRTLFRYWQHQDDNKIYDIVSNSPGRSDAFVFQSHLSSPVVNVLFDNTTDYCHNSNLFSLRHVKDVDRDLILHSLLARFVGLFAISLSEREILHSKVEPYFSSILSAFEDFELHYNSLLVTWNEQLGPSKLLERSTIYNALKNDVDINSVKFEMLMSELQSLLRLTVETAAHFDSYSKEVQEGLIEDYPWFKLLVKLKRFAQYKVVNHKLIHLEDDLSLKPKHDDYLEESHSPKKWFRHLIHGEVPFTAENLSDHFSTHSRQVLLWGLYDAAERQSFKDTIKWIVVLHDAISSLRYKLS